MSETVRNLAVLFLLTSALSACAGSGGDALLRSGDYSGAVAAYEAAEQASPDDGELKRNLGVAYLRTGQHDRALAKLEEARALRPGDPRVHFFLADAHEALGDFEGALLAYRDYLDAGGKNEASLQLRVRELARKRAGREIELALREEVSRAVPSDSMTLAIPDFTNISGSRQLSPLAKGLSAVVITDLRRVNGFRIVERERWHVLRSELELAYTKAALMDSSSAPAEAAPSADSSARAVQSASPERTPETGEIVTVTPDPTDPDLLPAFEEDESGLIDPTIAPVLGRVLGAGTLVQGLFTAIGETEIQLDAAIVDIQSTETTIAGQPVAGNLYDVLRLEKQLVYQILQTLGVTPTTEEREEIEALFINDFQNFFDFCRALVFEEQARFEEASPIYRELLRREPEFARRMDVERRITEPGEDFLALQQSELDALAEPVSSNVHFLDDVVVSVGNGPGPDGGVGVDQEDDDGDDLTVTDVGKVEQDLETIPDFPPPPGERR